MADADATTAKRILRHWPWLIPVMVLIAGLEYRDHHRYRTDEEKVLEAYAEFVEAMIDEDFDDAWELTAEVPRRAFARILDQWKGLDDSDPNAAEHWQELFASTWLTRDDILGMDAEEFFIAGMEAVVEHQEDEWERQVRDIMRLAVDRVEVVEDRGRIYLTFDSEPVLNVLFVREGGDWLFHSGIDNSIPKMEFKTLARKLAAYLPKNTLDCAKIIVIEVGDASITEEEMAALQRYFHALAPSLRDAGRDFPVVHLEVHPEMLMQDFIRILDVPHTKGFERVSFADTITTTPPPGIRINGVPLNEIEDVTTLPDVGDHPALKRVISASSEPEDIGRLKKIWKQMQWK